MASLNVSTSLEDDANDHSTSVSNVQKTMINQNSSDDNILTISAAELDDNDETVTTTTTTSKEAVIITPTASNHGFIAEAPSVSSIATTSTGAAKVRTLHSSSTLTIDHPLWSDPSSQQKVVIVEADLDEGMNVDKIMEEVEAELPLDVPMDEKDETELTKTTTAANDADDDDNSTNQAIVAPAVVGKEKEDIDSEGAEDVTSQGHMSISSDLLSVSVGSIVSSCHIDDDLLSYTSVTSYTFLEDAHDDENYDENGSCDDDNDGNIRNSNNYRLPPSYYEHLKEEEEVKPQGVQVVPSPTSSVYPSDEEENAADSIIITTSNSRIEEEDNDEDEIPGIIAACTSFSTETENMSTNTIPDSPKKGEETTTTYIVSSSNTMKENQNNFPMNVRERVEYLNAQAVASSSVVNAGDREEVTVEMLPKENTIQNHSNTTTITVVSGNKQHNEGDTILLLGKEEEGEEEQLFQTPHSPPPPPADPPLVDDTFDDENYELYHLGTPFLDTESENSYNAAAAKKIIPNSPNITGMVILANPYELFEDDEEEGYHDLAVVQTDSKKIIQTDQVDDHNQNSISTKDQFYCSQEAILDPTRLDHDDNEELNAEEHDALDVTNNSKSTGTGGGGDPSSWCNRFSFHAVGGASTSSTLSSHSLSVPSISSSGGTSGSSTSGSGSLYSRGGLSGDNGSSGRDRRSGSGGDGSYFSCGSRLSSDLSSTDSTPSNGRDGQLSQVDIVDMGLSTLSAASNESNSVDVVVKTSADDDDEDNYLPMSLMTPPRVHRQILSSSSLPSNGNENSDIFLSKIGQEEGETEDGSGERQDEKETVVSEQNDEKKDKEEEEQQNDEIEALNQDKQELELEVPMPIADMSILPPEISPLRVDQSPKAELKRDLSPTLNINSWVGSVIPSPTTLVTQTSPSLDDASVATESSENTQVLSNCSPPCPISLDDEETVGISRGSIILSILDCPGRKTRSRRNKRHSSCESGGLSKLMRSIQDEDCSSVQCQWGYKTVSDAIQRFTQIKKMNEFDESNESEGKKKKYILSNDEEFFHDSSASSSQSSPLKHYEDGSAMLNKSSTIKYWEQRAIRFLKRRKYEEALELFHRILEVYSSYSNKTEGNGKEGLDCRAFTGATHHNIAVVHMLNGSYNEAITELKQAIIERKDSLDKQHIDYISSLIRIGTAFYALDDFIAAEENWLNALSLLQLRPSPPPAELVEVLNSLACVQFEIGQPSKALHLFKECLDTHASDVVSNIYSEGGRPYEGEKLKQAIIRSNIGYIHFKVKHADLAIEAFEAALVDQETFLDDIDSLSMSTLDHLALAYCKRGKKEKAYKIYSRMLASQIEQNGADHMNCIQTLTKLNLLQSKLTKTDKHLHVSMVKGCLNLNERDDHQIERFEKLMKITKGQLSSSKKKKYL